VVLYGPTDPGRFWHGVDARGIVRSPLTCCTSELHEVCFKLGHPTPGDCMSAISVDMVMAAVTQFLNSFEKPFVELRTQQLIDERSYCIPCGHRRGVFGSDKGLFTKHQRCKDKERVDTAKANTWEARIETLNELILRNLDRRKVET